MHNIILINVMYSIKEWSGKVNDLEDITSIINRFVIFTILILSNSDSYTLEIETYIFL